MNDGGDAHHGRSQLGHVFDAYQNLRQIARCITFAAAQRGVARPRVLELSRQPTAIAEYAPDATIVRFATHDEHGRPMLAAPPRLPFADSEFDASFVTDAYEHVPEHVRQVLLAEMVRVTDGIVLLGTPHRSDIVDRFDKIAFDFVWGKYAEEFEPLAQHDDFGLEPLEVMEERFARLGARSVAALPCNYVYRWIHQILVYFDLQHDHPHGDLFEPVNRAYNELVSPYDYREPCYRYLLVVPTDPALDIEGLTAAMQAPAEAPQAMADAEGVLVEAFRAADAHASDRLRRYTHEVAAAHAELDRLRAEVAASHKEHDRLRAEDDQLREQVAELEAGRAWRLDTIADLQGDLARALGAVEQLQSDNRWALDEIATLRSQDEILVGILDEVDEQMRALLASRRWQIGDRVVNTALRAVGRRFTERAADPAERLLERVRAWRAQLATEIPVREVEPEAPPVARRWEPPRRRHYDVIVLANVDWHTRRQRPQHLAAAFAAQGHRVYYVVSSRWLPPNDPKGYRLTLVAPDVWEVVLSAERDPDRYAKTADAALVRRWTEAFACMRDDLDIDYAAVHVHLPSWTPLALSLRDQHGWLVVYDCMDEWEGFPGMGAAVVRTETDLAARADLVVTTANALRRKWARVNQSCVLVRNAVDASWFNATAGPSDLLADAPRPVVGFIGGIAEWLDLDLVAAVAKQHPDWSFLLIGDVFVQDLAGLNELPNVRLTGLRPYDEMPLWLFGFDVAIMPFRVDRISAAVDPVKFYEYFALGTPVVTTPLPELDEHRENLYVARTPDEFGAAIDAALTEPYERRDARVAVAHANTWEDRYRTLDGATKELWPLVSVVVVTYGRIDLTRACIESLIASTAYPRWELIVVDNGSTDGTPAYLRHLEAVKPEVRIVLNAENRGFPAACNQGLAAADGDILVLLNNDTVVPPNWLMPLLDHLDDPSIGLVGPRSNVVGNAARLDVDYRDMEGMGQLAARMRTQHRGESFEISMLAFMCVAMRREIFEAVGPLDEGYGIGLFEDDDYAERVKAAGFRIVCAADAFIHHVGQGTFEGLLRSGDYQSLWDRNQARFEARWGTWLAQDGPAGAGIA